jgi:hypothetical protein
VFLGLVHKAKDVFTSLPHLSNSLSETAKKGFDKLRVGNFERATFNVPSEWPEKMWFFR